MKQYTSKEFIKIVIYNGYHYSRCRGSHYSYVNKQGNHISIPRNLECVIAQRLVKENNLNTKLKNK